MKNSVTALTFLIILVGCSKPEPAAVITEQCVAEGMKLEGCTCMASLLKTHLPEEAMRDLAKTVKSNKTSDENTDRLIEQTELKMKAYLDSLPMSDKIKVTAEFAIGTGKCTPKLF